MEIKTDDYKGAIQEDLEEIKKCKVDVLILQRENDKLCNKNNEEIERLYRVIENKERSMQANLTESGEKKIETSFGFCSYREMPDKWDYSDSEIILWCRDFKMPYYYTQEIVKKLDLKNDIKNGKLELAEVPGVTITPQEPKFNYKLNGGI